MRTQRLMLIWATLIALLLNTTANAQERRRWSPQAKGAVIGTAAGGAAGAIINKRNRVVGGLIGAGAGGAAGYAIGKGIDNRRKTNARIAAAEREAAAARREAALARQEAASAQTHATKSTARAALAQRSVTPVAAAATGAAIAAAAYSNTQEPSLLTSSAFLLNPTYGNPATAYPTSEVRRKSW